MELTFSCQNHLGIITLTRPQALNALTLSMIKAIQQQLLDWQTNSTIHAVVITGEGGKAFCAGGDVRWLYDTGRANDPIQMEFFWHEYRLNHFIHQFNKPYIALMDGITMGGGVGISLHGSHPIASERFSFAMPETGIGFFPDIGASYLLNHCPGEVGTYLGLTGNRINCWDALSCGLIKYVVKSEQFPRLIKSLSELDLSEYPSERTSDCIQNYAEPTMHSTLNSDWINSCFAYDCIEDILASLAADKEWGQPIAENLLQKAPLSLKITLAQIRKAKKLSMAECMQLDYCLVSHFMNDSDFYEGVRALLVDKDKMPKWQPGRLNEVSNSNVADYFECGQIELEFI